MIITIIYISLLVPSGIMTTHTVWAFIIGSSVAHCVFIAQAGEETVTAADSEYRDCYYYVFSIVIQRRTAPSLWRNPYSSQCYRKWTDGNNVVLSLLCKLFVMLQEFQPEKPRCKWFWWLGCVLMVYLQITIMMGWCCQSFLMNGNLKLIQLVMERLEIFKGPQRLFLRWRHANTRKAVLCANNWSWKSLSSKNLRKLV